jgi:chemotaxis protein histidine kinase CheA
MDEVLRQVVHVFAQEVKEQAERVVRAILAMDSDAATVPAQIEEVYRQLHSLKGSASSLGIVDLEQLAHTLEEALTPLRRGQGALTPVLCDVALRAMDAARLRADGLVADTEAGAHDVGDSIVHLRRLVETREGMVPGAATAQLPAAAERAQPTVDPEGETVRISGTGLTALARRLDELREVRIRLDQRWTAAQLLHQSLEQLWSQARTSQSRAQVDALWQALRRVSALKRDLLDDAELAQSNAAGLDESLRAIQVVPARFLSEPLSRALREACRRTGKEANLRLDTGEAQLDRRLLDELKAPLVHLLRNAVDHGIEPPEVREAVGKPRRAVVAVTIEQRGSEIWVEVLDDGRGIDLGQVRARAVEMGLFGAEHLTDSLLYDLLFRPGFSTASEVTELSGRGVGLDVVRDTVARLHGRIEVTSTMGQGAAFRLHLPLTVAASEVMLVEEGGRAYGVPLAAIERIVRAPVDVLRSATGQPHYQLEDHSVPVLRLSRILGMTERYEGSSFCTLAIVRSAAHRVGLVCERLLGSRDLVLRPLPLELQPIRLLDAAAILPDGKVLLVLSAAALVEQGWAPRSAAANQPITPPGNILVADDSITTRSLISHLLEGEGFHVRTASDGDEALRLALAESFDLVVSDVRMPRLDGFSLTARLRANPATARVPVVLFSSLDSDEDKRRGSASGANAYLTKQAFDRGVLIDVVSSLIARRSA